MGNDSYNFTTMCGKGKVQILKPEEFEDWDFIINNELVKSKTKKNGNKVYYCKDYDYYGEDEKPEPDVFLMVKFEGEIVKHSMDLIGPYKIESHAFMLTEKPDGTVVLSKTF